MKKEKITIDLGLYHFLVEKLQERCELYSENKFLQYKLKTAKLPEMTVGEWILYRDFIKHRWYPFENETDRDNELALAELMIKRTEEQEKAFDTFQKMNAERNN